MPPFPSLALGGSRSLSASPVVVQFIRHALADCSAFSVGCCVGADALCLSFLLPVAPPSFLSVFAAFGRGGAGACSVSAVSVVASAASAGVPVRWWSGGGPLVPLAARLAQRSQAVVLSAAALVLFSPGAGSLAVGAFAVSSGRPVFVFAPAAPTPLPGLGGVWAVTSLCGLSCWRWQAAQLSLF